MLPDRNVETRPVPASRDDNFVRSAVGVATQKQPVCGHKSAPLLAKWPGYSWFRMNVPEIMHGTCSFFEIYDPSESNLIQTTLKTDVKNLCDNIVRLLIGKTSSGEDGYSGWGKDASHRKQSETLGIFENTWTANGGPFHWRLSKDERQALDVRTSKIVWPHYIEPLYYRGASFWKKPSRMWKSRRKYRLLLFVLPVLLRDQLPRVRKAIVLLASALRRLDGQAYSYERAKSLGILPGSRAINREELDSIHRDLVISLVLIEGCFPVGHLIPSTHHVVHYAEYTKTHGILRSYWMMAFERYNKYIKNLVQDMYQAEVHLSGKVTVDSACYYDRLAKNQVSFTANGLHTCVLTFACSKKYATVEDLDDVICLGGNVSDQEDLTVYTLAKILGKHFAAGEWDRDTDSDSRCGSVITCVVNGRSLYAHVVRFLKSDVPGDSCPGYASVRWFSEPTYDNCLCPKVTLNGSDIEDEVGSNVVRITQIDPSQVAVERVGDGSFYMIRDSGTDTRRK